MNGTITAPCGDIIPIASIDVISGIEKHFCFDFELSMFKEYRFTIHTIGGRHYQMAFDTEIEAQAERQAFIDAINGFVKI
jgi:hypothetical protein